MQELRDARAGRLEDAEWLATTGESEVMAAHRLGFPSVDAMQRSLWRAGRGDIARALAANTPEWTATG